MDASRFKLLVDPLYGRIAIDDFLADLIAQPEMQRLRDVRLSNINSLLLPGGSNISRTRTFCRHGIACRASLASCRLGAGRQPIDLYAQPYCMTSPLLLSAI